MPKLSVWTLRLALIHLVIGWTLGALALANKGLPFSSVLWLAVPIHIQLVLYGWTLQLIVGVAYWILPTVGRERPRTPLVVASVTLINLGVLAGCVAPFAGPTWSVAGACLVAAAAASFGLHAWPRIKAFGA